MNITPIFLKLRISWTLNLPSVRTNLEGDLQVGSFINLRRERRVTRSR